MGIIRKLIECLEKKESIEDLPTDHPIRNRPWWHCPVCFKQYALYSAAYKCQMSHERNTNA